MRLRVATYNIRAAIGPGEPFPAAWWRHVQPERFERIGAIVIGLGADVVLLQEVSVFNVHGELVDQPAAIAASTGMTVRYAAVHAFSLIEPDSGRAIGSAHWGNAILTRKPLRDPFAAGLPVGTDDALVEPAGSGRPLAGIMFGEAPYGSREPRCALGGVLDHGDISVVVVGTHLSYAGADQRRSQARALADLADAATARADGAPVIVGGDFNAPIEADELEPLTGRFEDAFTGTGVPAGDACRASAGPDRIDHLLQRGTRP
ncbi:MAG: endonuclease/exonuclease/phosphatase family protein, partial [Candidatus Limnocylindrales bacterium]